MKNRACLSFSPFAFFAPPTRTRCVWTICALLPAAAYLFAEKCFGAILMIFALSLAGVLAGIASNAAFKKNLFDGAHLFALEGYLCGFCIPQGFNVAAAFFALFFSILAFSGAFGGFQNAAARPAALAAVVCFLLSPQSFLQQAEAVRILPFEEWAQNVFFRGVQIPDGFLSALADNGSAIPACRFPIFFLIAAVFLASFGMADFVSALSFLAFFALFVGFGGGFSGGVLQGFSSCGAFFCAFFIMQSLSRCPQFYSTKIFFGLFCAAFSFLAAKGGMAQIAIPLSVLCADLIFPLVFAAEEQAKRLLSARIFNMKGGKNEI